MPTPTVVVALLAAVATAAVRVPELPEQVVAVLPWIGTVAFVFAAGSVAKSNEAIWCGLFAACAVLFNPWFPCAIPEPGRFWAHLAAAGVAGVFAVRKW